MEPTPEQIDALAEEYKRLEKVWAEAKDAATEAAKPCDLQGELLTKLVAEFGQAHAAKSKIVIGIRYEIMSTTGVTSSLDQSMIQRFKAAMLKLKLGRIFQKMFTEVIEYRKLAEASLWIRSDKIPDKVQALYAKCILEKPRSPSLTVRLRKEQGVQ
jgi:hypothetical protein